MKAIETQWEDRSLQGKEIGKLSFFTHEGGGVCLWVEPEFFWGCQRGGGPVFFPKAKGGTRIFPVGKGGPGKIADQQSQTDGPPTAKK